MSWRVVMVSKPSKLDYSLGYMVVRDVESTIKVHLSEISVLIIENTRCSVTTALLSRLIEEKIKVIFCDEKRNPISELTAYYGSHDCSQKLKNQLKWSVEIKQQIWTLIVEEKIRNQSSLLQFYNLSQCELLDRYIDELEFNDSTNREGHAAKVYFNALFGMGFTRNSEDPINAALNYGYSIILSVFNREIVSNGYLTQLGLFHDNMFNQYNLSCDLMEPYRPIVDSVVKANDIKNFTREEKITIIKILNKEIEIDGKINTLLNSVKIYCKSIFNALDEQDLSLIKFPVINYEL